MPADDRPRYFTDEGEEFNPDLVPAPSLCATCARNGETGHRIVCNLTRADQRDEEVFICFDYRPMSPNVDREAVLRELCSQAGVEYLEDTADADAEDAGPIAF